MIQTEVSVLKTYKIRTMYTNLKLSMWSLWNKSQASLSLTRWCCLKSLRYPSIRDIEGKILKKKWFGLSNHSHISIVFDILEPVFEISKFNYRIAYY